MEMADVQVWKRRESQGIESWCGRAGLLNASMTSATALRGMPPPFVLCVLVRRLLTSDLYFHCPEPTVALSCNGRRKVCSDSGAVQHGQGSHAQSKSNSQRIDITIQRPPPLMHLVLTEEKSGCCKTCHCGYCA